MDVDFTTDTFQSDDSEAPRALETGTTPEESLDEGTTFDFTERTWKEDFTLIVENRKLFVARNILALVSPVFEKMFQSDFKEKDMDELELPGKKFKDMQDFLRCIYPGKRASVSEKNVSRILQLADEYQVSDLKSKCEEFLIGTLDGLSTDKVYDMLEHAGTYNLKCLMAKCVEKVSDKPTEFLHSAQKRVTIPLKVLCEIQSNMLQRFEQSNAEKMWFESAYRFVLSGLKRKEKHEIEKFKGWTGIVLQFPLTVSEFLRLNPPQSKFMLFDIEMTYSISEYFQRCRRDHIKLDCSVEENRLSEWTVSLFGRLVLKCGTSKNEDFTGTFEMSFKSGTPAQSKTFAGEKGNACYVFDETEGFIHNGKIDVEIHILAKRQKTE